MDAPWTHGPIHPPGSLGPTFGKPPVSIFLKRGLLPIHPALHTSPSSSFQKDFFSNFLPTMETSLDRVLAHLTELWSTALSIAEDCALPVPLPPFPANHLSKFGPQVPTNLFRRLQAKDTLMTSFSSLTTMVSLLYCAFLNVYLRMRCVFCRVLHECCTFIS